jgi:hypothetical protein
MVFGFASGQNLERDLGKLGITCPCLLEWTQEFLDVQQELTELLDHTSKTFNLPLFHQVDDIHKQYAATLHVNGVYAAWHVGAHNFHEFVKVHKDSLNNSRPLTSPVGVLSRIYKTEKDSYDHPKLDTAVNCYWTQSDVLTT